MEELLHEYVDFMNENHTVFSWATWQLFKQPNKEPSSYWADAKYKMEVWPNLREALFTSHLMPMTISPKAMGWAHHSQATVGIK